MGLDIGDRTVGVAMSDEGGRVAQGVCVVRRTDPERDVAAIRDLAVRHGVGMLVAGLPRALRGQIGPQAEKVLGFVTALRTGSGLPVALWDERLSTRAAQRTLREAGVRRQRRRSLVDQVAATLILQGFLDARPPWEGPAALADDDGGRPTPDGARTALGPEE